MRYRDETRLRAPEGAQSRVGSDAQEGFDLLRVPLLGSFLRWRHARSAAQLVLGAVALVIVLHGLFGPELAPKNLATLLTWVHYRGLLVVSLLVLGNVFCMACPLMLPRSIARRFFKPTRRFPRLLRRKWLAAATFVSVLFAYEAWDLWGDPFWTATLILGFFVAALAIDASFRGAPFCKYVCPIGQFNFLTSTVSPFEVRAKNLDACATCVGKECIRGVRTEVKAPAPSAPVEQPALVASVASIASGSTAKRFEIVRPGCELALFLPKKTGNLDCTFCLDCVHACPHDNVAIATRLPGEELTLDPTRSGIGKLSKRPDFAVLAVLFCFGALLNAFGMVGPVYALQTRMAEALGTSSEVVVLALLFLGGLVVLPALGLGATGWLALRFGGDRGRVFAHVVRMAWCLIPLAVGVWTAHYLFHFLTGLWTFVPVAQNAVAELGKPLLGTPDWGRGGLHESVVRPIEIGFLVLGVAGSLFVAANLVRLDGLRRPRAAFAPWAVLLLALFAAAVWLMEQPMEMRGTFL